MDLTDDNLMQISQSLEIVSFIYFLSTCKRLYGQRSILMRCMKQPKNYDKYNDDNFARVIMNSYINIDDYCLPYYKGMLVDTGFVKLLKFPPDLCEAKLSNTMKIVNYHCTEDPQTWTRCKYKAELFADLHCNIVCQKYNYRYFKSSEQIKELFWYNWHNINIKMLDLCEIAYHIKQRKYQRLQASLESIQFDVHILNIPDTLKYMLDITQSNYVKKSLRVAIVCIMYTYIAKYTEEIKSMSSKLSKVMMNKAKELSNDIMNIKGLPKYIKIYIINKLNTTSELLK